MKKLLFALTALSLPALGFADPVPYVDESKVIKAELISQIAEDRDQAIEAAQTLDETEKNEAISQAQAAFWAQIDPILSEEAPEEAAPTLVEKALAAIKSIFN